MLVLPRPAPRPRSWGRRAAFGDLTAAHPAMPRSTPTTPRCWRSTPRGPAPTRATGTSTSRTPGTRTCRSCPTRRSAPCSPAWSSRPSAATPRSPTSRPPTTRSSEPMRGLRRRSRGGARRSRRVRRLPAERPGRHVERRPVHRAGAGRATPSSASTPRAGVRPVRQPHLHHPDRRAVTAESDALARLLHEDATAPEHVFRHRWRTGDVVVWDNRATMHLGVRDYGDAHRVLHRVTIAGDRPRRLALITPERVEVAGRPGTSRKSRRSSGTWEASARVSPSKPPEWSVSTWAPPWTGVEHLRTRAVHTASRATSAA